MAKQLESYTIAMLTRSGTWLVQRARLTFEEYRIVFDVLKTAADEGLLSTFHMDTEDKPMDFDDTFASFRPLALAQFWPEELKPKKYRA